MILFSPGAFLVSSLEELSQAPKLKYLKTTVTWSVSKTAIVNIDDMKSDSIVFVTLNSTSSACVAYATPSDGKLTIGLNDEHNASHPVSIMYY